MDASSISSDRMQVLQLPEQVYVRQSACSNTGLHGFLDGAHKVSPETTREEEEACSPA